MRKNKTIIPTKEEVISLLNVAKSDKIIHMKTVNELLGMKWVDSHIPKIKGEPEWGYEGLREFFISHSIDGSCTFEEALEKLDT
jgi:hypothetical protein